jgi:hypothetical protein
MDLVESSGHPSQEHAMPPRWWGKLLRVAIPAVLAIGTVGYLTSGLSRREGTRDESWKREVIDPSLTASVAAVDAVFENTWQAAALEPSGPADWRTVSRRVALGLIGTGVSLEELSELEALPEPHRVDAWVEKLLGDPRWSSYFAERLSRSWVGNEDGPFILFRRRRFNTWLSDQLAGGRPYDQIVREMVTANGFFTDKPAVNFLTSTYNTAQENRGDPIRLAGRTSRSMLGVRIDCLQCHDDFLGNVSLGDEARDGQQIDFHRLAAFYSGATLNGLRGVYDDGKPYDYQLLHEDKAETIEPAVPYGAEYLPADGSPRERLAGWITSPQNRQAARAATNRIWALVTGKPLVEPVDDIPLHAPGSEALNALADDFVAHGFDIRRLIRVITRTRAFRLDSRADFEVTPEIEAQWAVFPLTRLRPEQVAGAIIQAARLTAIDADSSLLERLIKFTQTNDFLTRYGDTGEDQFRQDSVTVTQRLILMNGQVVGERTEENPVLNASSQINILARTDEQALESIFLAVLNRLPSEKEAAHFLPQLTAASAEGARGRAIEDQYWVLLNCSEFSWNH